MRDTANQPFQFTFDYRQLNHRQSQLIFRDLWLYSISKASPTSHAYLIATSCFASDSLSTVAMALALQIDFEYYNVRAPKSDNATIFAMLYSVIKGNCFLVNNSPYIGIIYVIMSMYG